FSKFTTAVLHTVAENVARTLVRAKVDDVAMVLFGAKRITSEEKTAAGQRKALDAVVNSVLLGFFHGVRNSLERNHLRNPLRAITICDTSSNRCDEIEEALARRYEMASDAVDITLDRITLPKPRDEEETKTGPRPIVLQATQERDKNDEWITLRYSVLPTETKATGLFRDKSIRKKDFEKVVGYVNDTNAADTMGFIYNNLPGPRRGVNWRRKSTDFEGALVEYGDWMGKKLLPADISTVLKQVAKKRRVIVTHDGPMSRVPWETLHIDEWFPAADGGMSRQYFTNDMPMTNWLEERRLRNTLHVLLIVNPTGDLEGADKEGKRIEKILGQMPGVEFEILNQEQATKEKIKEELESGKYDMLHYAGHTSFFPEKEWGPAWSGILCAHKHYPDDEKGCRNCSITPKYILSGNDLREMAHLPSLVFFSSCQSGRVGGLGQKGTTATDRNIGLAEAFLRGGVANYVGTHWWVSDDAAPKFVNEFYGALIRGESIGTAVQNGRKAVRRRAKSLDWADFIHYGNPDFVLKFKKPDEYGIMTY
ncbi:MAG: CHAT domain-containing protein, partial [Gammaproteobacteria bacterium]|nr:CHAT domain-containing protein [Gammaproteobacteria bacterium]